MSTCTNNQLPFTPPSVHTPSATGGPDDSPTQLCYGDVVTMYLPDPTSPLFFQWGGSDCDIVGAQAMPTMLPTQSVVQVQIVSTTTPSQSGEPVYDGDAVYLVVNQGTGNGTTADCNETDEACPWGILSYTRTGRGDLPTYYAASSSSGLADNSMNVWYLRDLNTITAQNAQNPLPAQSSTPLYYGSPIGISTMYAPSSYMYTQLSNLLQDIHFTAFVDFAALSIYGLGETAAQWFGVYLADSTTLSVPTTLNPSKTQCKGGGTWTCSSGDKGGCAGAGGNISCPAGAPCDIVCDPKTCICTCPTTCASQGTCPQQINASTCQPGQCNDQGCINGGKAVCDPSTQLYNCNAPASNSSLLIAAGVIAGLVLFVVLTIILVVKVF